MNTYLPFQKEGIEYAMKRRGTLFADDMGLGKTVQAIGVVNEDQKAFAQGPAGPVNEGPWYDANPYRVVVVCPVSVKLNWRKELREWLQVEADIAVIGYSETKKVNYPYHTLIVDEAQYIKNESSARSKEIRRLAKLATRKVMLLTGTPYENKVRELWPLLMVMNEKYWNPPIPPPPPMRQLPGNVILISSRAPIAKKTKSQEERNQFSFLKRYCGPETVEFFKKGKSGPQKAYKFDGGSNLEELNERLKASGMIRRLKRDVLSQLPPKRREIVVFPTVHIEDDEIPLFIGRIFDKLTIDNYDDIVGQLHADKVAFQAWSRYRHMQGLEKLPDVIDHLKSVLESVHKVIVFAHHRDVIQSIHENMNFLGAVCITGETPAGERQRNVERFQTDPRIRVFIGSIRAAGTGITLTASSHVVFAEIDPNIAWLLQSEDRAHRITQDDSVLIQYLVSDRSIDARLCQIAKLKLDLMTKGIGV